MNKKTKFLIIRFSSIGDIVLTTPVVRCLKNQIDLAVVHYLTKPQFHDVIKYNPYIDKILLLKEPLSDTIKEIKAEEYDYIIDLHNNLRTRLIKSRFKNIAFSFNKLNLQKWLIVNLKIDKLPDIHIVDRYLNTVSLFDIKNDYIGLDYFNSSSEEVAKTDLPERQKRGYVALVIGAKHETKKLPLNKLKELIQKINYPFVILGGPEDDNTGKTLEQVDTNRVYNACGKYSINQSAQLLNQSAIVITHDTGLMHIAAAYKKKIISIWGNTIPEFGMYPYFPKGYEKGKFFWMIEEKLSCRPCSKIGYKKCPKGHFKCMNNINIDYIVDLVNKNFDDEA